MDEKARKKIEAMSAQERYDCARQMLSKPWGPSGSGKSVGTVSSLINHIQVHENTEWLAYKPHLPKQIRNSYAAHAFNTLQQTAIHYEYIRICAFWDGVDLESRSIPTIVALADCRDVARCVYEDNSKLRLGDIPEWREEDGRKARRRLRDGIREAKAIEKSEMLKRARNFRNKLAHPIEKTRAERKGVIPNPKHGDAKKLLGKTITIVKRLHLSLNGTSFDWTDNRRMHRRNAEALWKGVTIDVLR